VTSIAPDFIRDVQTVLSEMADYTVPDAELLQWTARGTSKFSDSHINVYDGGGREIVHFVRLRCALEFAERLSTRPNMTMSRVFTYVHNGTGESRTPLILNGEDSLVARSLADSIALGDTVILTLQSFAGGREAEMPRVAGTLAQMSPFIFFNQMGLGNTVPVDAVTGWFKQFDYVPVQLGILDGLYMPRV
jgi:hypothetical protein